jgi:hypothetical protein
MNQRVWDVEEEKGISGEVLEGSNISIDLRVTIWDIAFHYVLTNTNAMAAWVKYKMTPSW